MEARFKSLSVFEFQERFPDNESCIKHLASVKWAEGYKCPKCGHDNYCYGKQPYSRQCTSCRYTESPAAGTLFHKVKFPLVKAFWIVYYLSTNKKGMASTELSRKLDLRQKTCWLFKQKVMRAMASSGDHPLKGHVEADEFILGQQEEGKRGREAGNKKLVAITIEKKGKGVSRMYARHISKASGQQLGAFLKNTVDASAQLRTDGWTGYKPLKQHFPNMIQESSGKKGNNFNTLHRVIMGFKAWLRGIHAHAELLQGYLDEYCYRFNRSFMKENIFDNLMERMIKHKPCPYKMIIN